MPRWAESGGKDSLFIRYKNAKFTELFLSVEHIVVIVLIFLHVMEQQVPVIQVLNRIGYLIWRIM